VADQPRLAVESIAGQRPYQEDSVLAEALTDGRTLVAVADGMGGHAAGEVASRLALDALTEAVAQGQGLAEAFRLANQRVHRMAQEPAKLGMGTTLVAILVDGSGYTVANVGDSRVYLVSAQGVRRLTEDHSFVAEAMRRGQSEAEAMATPWKDALTRSIGTEEDVDADVSGPHPLPVDAALIICSDGLYKSLSDDAIRDRFMTSSGAQGAAQALVAAAFDAGSDDNISIAIAEFGEVRRGSAPSTMVLSYDAENAAVEARAERERVEAASPEAGAGEIPTAVMVDEGAVAAVLPLAAAAAVVVVVGALVAILLFGG
jgi:protein phosphatase